MTFQTIDLKWGIKHVFLVLDAALRLGDTPFIVLGTVCTGNNLYLLRDSSDSVFTKPPRENPGWAKAILPCPFLCQPLYACGRLPPCPFVELPVAQYNLSSRRMSFAELTFHSDIRGPCAQSLDSYNTSPGVAFPSWSCQRPLRWDPFVPRCFLGWFQQLVASTGMFGVAKPAYIGYCFVVADWASFLWVCRLLFSSPTRLLWCKRLLPPLPLATACQR